MSKDTKQRMMAGYEKRFRDVQDYLVVNYQGIPSEKVNDLRKSLRREKASMTVNRNALALKTFGKLDHKGLEGLVKSPAALAYGDDAVAVARALCRWIDEAGDEVKLQILGGVLGGRPVAPVEVKALSKLPDRKTMLAQVLATVMAPASVIANLLQSTLTQVPYMAANHADQKEKEGPGSQPAAAAS